MSRLIDGNAQRQIGQRVKLKSTHHAMAPLLKLQLGRVGEVIEAKGCGYRVTFVVGNGMKKTWVIKNRWLEDATHRPISLDAPSLNRLKTLLAIKKDAESLTAPQVRLIVGWLSENEHFQDEIKAIDEVAA